MVLYVLLIKTEKQILSLRVKEIKPQIEFKIYYFKI